MKRPVHSLLAALLCCTFAQAEVATVPQSQEPTDFVRFQEDASGAKLQTSIATYRHPNGVIVDLVGAIHIADKPYYEKLNQRFTRYDALLYEMVGGPIQSREERMAAEADAANSAEVAASKRLSWLNTLYQTLQNSLALDSQLEGIDYHKPNFVHADMTLAQFSELQTERNEGFLSLWMKAIKAQMDMPQTAAQPGLLQILEILVRKDSATELKRIVGRTFDSVEMLMTGMESGDGTVIISERNKLALEVLKQQVISGRKNIGVFYGAAHLPDMEKRLLTLGFKRQGVEWMDAWSLPPPPVIESKPPSQPQSQPAVPLKP